MASPTTIEFLTRTTPCHPLCRHAVCVSLREVPKAPKSIFEAATEIGEEIDLFWYRQDLEEQDEYARSPLFAPCDPGDD